VEDGAMDGHGDFSSSPTPGSPVEVQIRVQVKGIQEIDAKRGQTLLQLSFKAFWTDQRVALACKRDPAFELPEAFWIPGIKLANAFGEREQLLDSKPIVEIKNRATGEVWGIFYIS